MQYHNELQRDTRRQSTATVARNNTLYASVRAGDLSARERLICANMPLAIWLTDAYLRAWPQYQYLHSDLLSEAFMGLVDAVDGLYRSCPKGRINPTSYISNTIRRRLSASTRTEALARFKTVALNNRDVERSANDWTEILEALDAACTSEVDRLVVRLRAARYTFREIGAKLCTDGTTVCKWLRAIRRRFDALSA